MTAGHRYPKLSIRSLYGSPSKHFSSLRRRTTEGKFSNP